MLEDSYRLGARSVDPDIHIDVGYVPPRAGGDAVYDAAHELLESGVDLILACAGEANAQIIQAVREAHGYVLLADDRSVGRGRGTVLAAVVTDRAKAAENAVRATLAVPTPPAARGRLCFDGGYLEFRPGAPLYRRVLPKQVRDAQADLVRRLAEGELTLDR
jgi:basic membrane lipoprotein Med (substrate-binding protein (PBP1-ABC) superfamily)